MMLKPQALAILASLLLTGCLGDDQPGPQPPSPQGNAASNVTVLPFGLAGCTFAVAVLGIDPARLAPFVPDGFELAVGTSLAGPGSAFLGFESFECEGEGLGDTPGSYAYGSVFAGVIPNETFTKPGVEDYYVKWDTLVANATKREVLQAAGVPAWDGRSTAQVETVGPIGTVVASLDMADGGAFRMNGTGLSGTDRPGFEYIEYVPAGNGTLGAWHSTTNEQPVTVSGRGVLVVEAGSWYGDLVGPDPVPVNIGGATWSFAPGYVTVPVRSAADVR